MAKQEINKSKNTALESHKKSDKAKWAITFISLILIATLLGGLCYVVIEKIDVKKEVTNNVSGVISNGTYSSGTVASNVAYNTGAVATAYNLIDSNHVVGENLELLSKFDLSSGNIYKLSIHYVPDEPITHLTLSFGYGGFDFYMEISDCLIVKHSNLKGELVELINTSDFTISDLCDPSDIILEIIIKDESVLFNDTDFNDYNSEFDVTFLMLLGYLMQNGDSNISLACDYSDNILADSEEVFEEVYEYSEDEGTMPLPPAPTKEGYTFTGWYTDEECTIPYEGTTITEDTVLYAGWKINTYTVTFDSDGGSNVSIQTVDWNTSAKLTIPTKTGHTFLGWFLPSGEQYTNQPIKSATTLKAKWQANKYTVTFNSDGGSAVDSKTVEYGKSVTITTPTKTGFDFVGWFLPSGDKYTNQAITDNVTLTARWTIKKLSVSFNTDGGSAVTDKQVEYGKPVDLTTPEKEGYNFLGWFLPSGDKYTNQAITENVTLTAKWEIKTFKVTFIVDGEIYREMTVDYGTTLVDVANRAEVNSKNILSYKFVDDSIPTINLGAMKVVGDIEVKANAPTESDITISKIKNNTFAIIGGVLGGLVLIMVVCGVVTAIKRR